MTTDTILTQVIFLTLQYIHTSSVDLEENFINTDILNIEYRNRKKVFLIRCRQNLAMKVDKNEFRNLPKSDGCVERQEVKSELLSNGVDDFDE